MIRSQPGIKRYFKPQRGTLYDLTNPVVKLMSGSWTFDEGMGPLIPCEISKGFYDITLPSSGGVLTNNYSWQYGPRGNVLDRLSITDAITNGPANAFIPGTGSVWFAFRILPRAVASDTYGQIWTNTTSGNGLYLRSTGKIDWFLTADHVSTNVLTMNAWNDVVLWWTDKMYCVINGVLDTSPFTLGTQAALNKFLPGTEPMSCQMDYFHFGVLPTTLVGSAGATDLAQSLIDDPWQVFQVPNYKKWTTFGGASVINKSIVDNLTISETLLLNTVLNRSLTDTITVGETNSRLMVFARSLNDNLTITETLTRIAIYNRSIVDSLTISELLFKGQARTLTDTLSITDLVGLQRTISRAISDTLTPSESLTLQKIYSRLCVDSLTLTELIHLNTILTKVVSDTITITETVLAVKPGVTGSVFTVPNENSIVSAFLKDQLGNVWPAVIKVLN
jgi:hypothetical protein